MHKGNYRKKSAKRLKAYDKTNFSSKEIIEGMSRLKGARRKPTSIALEEELLKELKAIASKQGVPYHMKKSKFIVNKNPKELAITLGLSPMYAIEWDIRLKIINKIIAVTDKSDLSVTEIAKLAGTSRARITKILKMDTRGISLDVLVRVLGALGEEIKISFR